MLCPSSKPGRPCRQTILHYAPCRGFEPRLLDSESSVLPVRRTGISPLGQSHHWESNPEPPSYQDGALPLRHEGKFDWAIRCFCLRKCKAFGSFLGRMMRLAFPSDSTDHYRLPERIDEPIWPR